MCLVGGAKTAIPGVDQWLVDAIDRLARREGPGDLEGVLVSVVEELAIGETSGRLRCHFVARSADGKVRVKQLAALMKKSVVDYCLPRSRALDAHQRWVETGSTDHLVALAADATDLFARLETGGEGGELLLFMLLERLLGIPQLICKMNLKTNANVHFHGVDGVHVKILDSGNLGVYWCESKVHASSSSAIDSCFTSLAPFLLDEGDGESQRDLALVRGFLDTGDTELDEAVLRYFDESNLEATQREVRGAVLIGFDLDGYPLPHEDDGWTVREEVLAAVEGWIERIEHRMNDAALSAIDIEVFCLPMPSVQIFRSELNVALGIET